MSRSIAPLLAILLAVSIASSAAEKTTTIRLARERVGNEPTRFLGVVGNWTVARDEKGAKVLQVDGRQWIKDSRPRDWRRRRGRFTARGTRSSSTA
jgi:hypothetical protein